MCNSNAVAPLFMYYFNNDLHTYFMRVRKSIQVILFIVIGCGKGMYMSLWLFRQLYSHFLF